jgi:6,7-dimethyl-8-ribityllumazine synthase
MSAVHEADLNGAGKRIAIVAGRFNDFVTQRLVSSAVECATQHGVAAADVDVYWVPGSFEVPQLARKLAGEGRFDGVICVGAIIRGDTNHFDNLCASVIFSIAEISSRFSVPVTYGMVTADTAEQALERAGGRKGNKGWDAALALIEMMGLWKG